MSEALRTVLTHWHYSAGGLIWGKPRKTVVSFAFWGTVEIILFLLLTVEMIRRARDVNLWNMLYIYVHVMSQMQCGPSLWKEMDVMPYAHNG